MFPSLLRCRQLATASLVSLLAVAGSVQARTTSMLDRAIDSLTAPRAHTSQFAPGSTYTLCFVPDGPSWIDSDDQSSYISAISAQS